MRREDSNRIKGYRPTRGKGKNDRTASTLKISRGKAPKIWVNGLAFSKALIWSMHGKAIFLLTSIGKIFRSCGWNRGQ